MRARHGAAFRNVVVLVTALALAGCIKSAGSARLDVEPAVSLPDSIALGQPFEATFTWQPGTEFAPPGVDYRVFVHVRNERGDLLFQDDHLPPVPTSQWAAGKEVVYRRWIYPPGAVRADRLDVHLGLYDGSSRVRLRWQGGWQASPLVHRVKVRTEDRSGIPMAVHGWYPQEKKSTPTETFHWTNGHAIAAFRNPRHAAVLHLRALSPVDRLQGAQSIKLLLGKHDIADLEVTDTTPFAEHIPIPAEAFGDDDWVELHIDSSPRLVPEEARSKAGDARILGLQIFTLYLAVGS
ncbi:MAG: hypothetical protein ACE5HV_00315 [Acidobacteriota bacterium]